MQVTQYRHDEWKAESDEHATAIVWKHPQNGLWCWWCSSHICEHAQAVAKFLKDKQAATIAARRE